MTPSSPSAPHHSTAAELDPPTPREACQLPAGTHRAADFAEQGIGALCGPHAVARQRFPGTVAAFPVGCGS